MVLMSMRNINRTLTEILFIRELSLLDSCSSIANAKKPLYLILFFGKHLTRPES